ncbi:hypothetical protein FIV34_16735 [Luteibacter pinisoli]|uniref:Peptidase M12B domain-containing protein n=1 Tax=Luteibacter pinisoli TaxID=2589080 RepID=A0A4Y5Z8S0_9GAMM|nr:hypothetical protein [Luteibacter pinisoli]QDE40735.1 hypothetical protein FIV34_16735 [Luteibacter pinisoli]
MIQRTDFPPACRRLRDTVLALAAAVGFVPMARADDAPAPIHVFAYVHDEIGASDERLQKRHFAPWLKEMRRLLPERRVEIHLRRDIPGITDIAYGKVGALFAWRSALEASPLEGETPGVRTAGRYNILLVKRRWVFPGAAGAAIQNGGPYAFASITQGASVPAHELGHLLGAVHAGAARRPDPVLTQCASLMWPEARALPSCWDYSETNAAQIQANRPDWDPQGPPPAPGLPDAEPAYTPGHADPL